MMPRFVAPDTGSLSGKAAVVLAIWVEKSQKYKEL